MAIKKDGINIGTITGGIVNFGGAVIIAPSTVTKSISGPSTSNTGTNITTNSPGTSSANGTNGWRS